MIPLSYRRHRFPPPVIQHSIWLYLRFTLSVARAAAALPQYHEGEVPDMLVQRWRDRRAALRLMRKLLRKQGFTPKSLTTDKLGSYGAAFRHLDLPA